MSRYGSIMGIVVVARLSQPITTQSLVAKLIVVVKIRCVHLVHDDYFTIVIKCLQSINTLNITLTIQSRTVWRYTKLIPQ
jgi:hypothetical protein